jgi:hypothetical protein
MSRITRLTVAALFCVALVVPSIAAAHPGQRGLGQTFPIASRLCVHTTNGHAPKALVASVPAVLAACTTLHTSFSDAQNAYTTTVGPLKTQAVAALKAARQTCLQARQTQTKGVCLPAVQAARTTILGLRAQVKTAAQTYHASIETARRAFWTTIHALKGGATVQTDPSTPPAPVVSMPLPTP